MLKIRSSEGIKGEEKNEPGEIKTRGRVEALNLKSVD